MSSRITYIECKAGELEGPARIGRVTFSRTMRSVHNRGRCLERLNPRGYKANFVDVESGEEYWTTIRGMPECKNQGTIRCAGKY